MANKPAFDLHKAPFAHVSAASQHFGFMSVIECHTWCCKRIGTFFSLVSPQITEQRPVYEEVR